MVIHSAISYNNHSLKHPRPHKVRRRGWVALLPLLLLVVLMTLNGMSGIIGLSLPMIVVFLITSVAALLTLRGYDMSSGLRIYSSGAGNPDLLLMVWIFVLAGAFANAAREMGAVSGVVDLCVGLIPPSYFAAGLFLCACLVSLCVGTSVGTIASIVPVAVEMSSRLGGNLPLLVGAIVGGAFFGDNLSFISDTTVAATKTQGCSMIDKFKANIRIAIPAAAIVLIMYLFIGRHETQSLTMDNVIVGTGIYYKILPYVMVLVLALMGINVLLVLTVGVALTGVIGIAFGNLTVTSWLEALNAGVLSMSDLILVSMMAGGMLAVVRKGGGVTWLVRGLTRRISGKRGAEFCLSMLVALTNVCTANNTVAILSVGEIAKSVAVRYGLSPRRTAGLLDTFSCVVQGVLPYGAQLLMAAGLSLLTPFDIIPCLFYPVALAAVALVYIAVSRR